MAINEKLENDIDYGNIGITYTIKYFWKSIFYCFLGLKKLNYTKLTIYLPNIKA